MPDPKLITVPQDQLQFDPASIRASGGLPPAVPNPAPSTDRIGPNVDPNATWLDTLLSKLSGPTAAQSGDEDYVNSPLGQFQDMMRGINPITLAVGEGKRALSIAPQWGLNAARFVARGADELDPQGQYEEGLSGKDPNSLAARIDALTTTGALNPRTPGERIGSNLTDLAAMFATDKGLGAVADAVPYAGQALNLVGKVPLVGPLAKTVLEGAGYGGLYGQLQNNDAEGGAVIGAGLGPLTKAIGWGGEKVLSPFLESAAERSLGRVIAPAQQGWKAFVNRDANEIIRKVPLKAAVPWQEGGGLKGIQNYAEAMGNGIKRDLDRAYDAQRQGDVTPWLASIRDRIQTAADSLEAAHQGGTLQLAPEAQQALQDVKTALKPDGPGTINPTDTNITNLRAAYANLDAVIGTIRPEMRRGMLTTTNPVAAQALQAGLQPGGAASAARGGIQAAKDDVVDLIENGLQGTRAETEPIAHAVDQLRFKFGNMNAQGEFVPSNQGFNDALQGLSKTIRSYGPEMNGDALRKLANDWGKIVAGPKEQGFLAQSIADESMKGALKGARKVVENARDTVMGPTVANQSDELSFWLKLGNAAESTTLRRTGHAGGGLFGQMAAVAGLEGGATYGAHAAGAGLLGTFMGAALAAPVAAVAVRVMKSPLWNLASAKAKLALSDGLAHASQPLVQQAMRQILLELSLQDHGGLHALGHQDLTDVEATHELARIRAGQRPTAGIVRSRNPTAVYGPGQSPDPRINTTLGRTQQFDAAQGDPGLQLLQNQDQIDQSIQDQPDPSQPESPESRLRGVPVTTAGPGGPHDGPSWYDQQLVASPDLGPNHPHLQRLADLVSGQLTPLNLAFLGDEALRPLAAGTKLAGASELVGKGLAAAMAAAGLDTGIQGVQEGRPGKVIQGGTQALLGALGLRSGGLARAGEEGAAALGSFGERLGAGLRAAGTQAVIGPAIGLASQGLADSDVAKSLIPDDEVRQAVFQAAGIGTAVGGLGMAARKGMKAAAEEAASARDAATYDAKVADVPDLPPTGLVDPSGAPVSSSRKATIGNALRAREVAINEHIGALEPEQKAAVVDEVANAFPPLDSFAKPTAHLSDKMLAKRAADLSPEAQQVVGLLRQNLPPGERISPSEIQAIITGREYIPDRTVRKFHVSQDPNAETLPGAPFDVTSRAHEQTRLREYMKLVKAGQDGWDWYEKGGRALMFAANDNPAFARQLAEALAATSSATDVLVNAGMGVKGVQQQRGGVDVRTGRYPAAMSKKVLAAMNDEAFASGLKHTAFADALSRAGGFLSKYTPDRPVNDIWQGEAWGYINRDGTALRRGFTPAEHAWMDRMSDKALALAKRDPELAKLIPPGEGEWNLSRLQAAAWVGAKRQAAREAALAKLRQGKSAGGTANLGRVGDFGTGIENSYAQMSRESAAGATTGHLPELLAQTPEGVRLRQAMHDLLRDPKFGVYDAKTRDQIIAHLGGLTGPSSETVGVFKGAQAPGVAAQVPAGYTTDPATGNRIIEPGSMNLMRAADNIYALVHAQDAAAGGRVLPAGTGQPRTAADIQLAQGTPSKAVVADIQSRIGKYGGALTDPVAVVLRPTGVALLNQKLPEADFRKLVREVNKVHGVKGGNLLGAQSGYYDENDWQNPAQRFGQGFYPQIEPFSAQFEQVAPALARNRLALEAELNKVAGYQLTTSPTMDRVHKTLANEGWAGLQKLAREFGVPVALLAAWASATGAPPPPPSDEQARPGVAAGA